MELRKAALALLGVVAVIASACSGTPPQAAVPTDGAVQLNPGFAAGGTVTVAVPAAAVALAVKVNVLVEVAGFGLKAAVTPLGRPEAEKLTLPVKPLAGVIVIVLVP